MESDDVAPRFDLRLAVCVPSHGGWRAGFGQSLANLAAHFIASRYERGRKDIEVFCVSGSILPDVRHKLAAHALQWDATHLLWLDSDMLFPRDAANRLLSHNVPVIAANYVRHTIPHLPTAYDGAALPSRRDDEGLRPVSHAGMGVMLTDARVFDLLDLPYFHFECCGDEPGLMGEDVWFCRKLRDVGITPFVDLGLSRRIYHIGEKPFHLDDYEPHPEPPEAA
jgi:hypothetical protein